MLLSIPVQSRPDLKMDGFIDVVSKNNNINPDATLNFKPA